jgi:transposase
MGSQRQIAEYFGVSRSFVEKLLQRRRQTGSLAARRQGGGPTPRITAAVQDHIRQLVQQQPDITLSELADALDRDCHIQVSTATVCTTLQKMGLPRKKSQYTPVNATRPRYVRHAKTTGSL